MDGAPVLPENSIQDTFIWLADHKTIPGEYRDPIQLISVNLSEVIDNPRDVQSGHLIPLDRGGKHEPRNAYLMLARSNQLQGNLKLDELLEYMSNILKRHNKIKNIQETTRELEKEQKQRNPN